MEAWNKMSVFEPRAHQTEALQLMQYECDKPEVTSTLLCLPPGAGKTKTAIKFLMDNMGTRDQTLWVVHNEQLLLQAKETIEEMAAFLNFQTERPLISFWNRDIKENGGAFVLTMVLSTRTIVGTYRFRVVDEAHHDAAASYQRLKEQTQADFDLGLTATPTRLDGKPLQFDSIACQKTIFDLAGKCLARARYIRFHTGQKHNLRRGRGDYTQTSLKKLNNEDRNQFVALEYATNRSEYGKTIVYAVDASHTINLATAIYEQDPTIRVTWVLGEKYLKLSERRQRIADFIAGKYDVIVNCQVLTEGIDIPDCRTIFLCRPTSSESLWIQMVGRGDRIAQGKDYFNVVDFVDDGTGMYSLLAKEWALNNLGQEPEETEEEKIKQSLTLIQEKLQHGGLNISIDRIQKEYLHFVGLLKVGSKFKSRPKTFMLTDEQKDCIDRLEIYLASDKGNLYEAINGSYGILVPSNEFSLAEWKMIGWALFEKKFRHRKTFDNGNMTYLYLPFYDDEVDLEAAKNHIQEMMQHNETLNDAWSANPTQLYAKLLNQYESILQDYYDLAIKLQPITFYNRVLQVEGNVPDPSWRVKSALFWDCRNMLQDLLREMLEDDGVVISIKPMDSSGDNNARTKPQGFLKPPTLDF